MEWREGPLLLSDDKSLLDLDLVHSFLAQTYWSPGVAREKVARSIEHSMAFCLLKEGAQVGFARVISDRATFAYLADVFILPAHQRAGLGKWMVARILEHPDLQGLRRWSLVTLDAHGLYAQLGFTPLSLPGRHMEILRPPPGAL